MNKNVMSNSLVSCLKLGAIFFLIIIVGCRQQTKPGTAKPKTVPFSMIDSIKNESDSTYSKPYFTRDFALAEYYFTKKDSTLIQIMKDKDSMVRQIIITKNKTRKFTAQYYPNGQLMAKYLLDNFGQFNGDAEEFYENGFIKASGVYKSGFHSGNWKIFDSTGNFISTDEYNSNGQKVKSVAK